MRQQNARRWILVLCAGLLTAPFVRAYGADGRLDGKVTDQKGAVVSGAKIVATDAVTGQTFTGTTDNQGRYTVNLAPGTYTVVVSAPGFSDSRHEGVKVADGAVAAFDVKLEVAQVEATVTVATVKGNTDPIYQELRKQGKSDNEFAGPFATVSKLVLKRVVAVFTLKSGDIYFAAPVANRVTAAVFVGDGELTLTPPTPIEKHSLAIFTNNEALSEPFSRLVIRFTDKTFDEIKASANAKMGTAGAQASRARDLYRDNQTLLRKELRDNRELRTLTDIYAPQRPGYFNAFIGGKRHEKLIFLLDPLGIPQVSPEEVALFSYGESDGGIWNAFHLADEYRKGTAASSEDHRLFDITHHEIDGVIKGTQITATDRVTLRPLVAGRVLNFELYRSLRISRVQDS